jgi:hypothetical protein
MDESALKTLIDSLNRQSDALHGRDHFWTACLIVGCAFEVIFVCHEYWDDRKDWRRSRTRGFVSFPEKPPISWLLVEMFSIILVLAGIGGELHVSIVAGHIETQLREANGSLVLLLEGKANDAETSAKNAATAAGVAQVSADMAGKVADRAIAGESALERENAALKAKIAPRRVSGDQAKKLCPFIHVDSPRSMEIESGDGETVEPDDFAGDIGRAIVDCQHGLSVTEHLSVIIRPVPRPFRIAYAPSRKDDAEMLNEALVKAQITAKPVEMVPVPNPQQQPDVLVLFVGPKLPEP